MLDASRIILLASSIQHLTSSLISFQMNSASISLDRQPGAAAVDRALNILLIVDAIHRQSEIVMKVFPATEARAESQPLGVRDFHHTFAASDVQPRIPIDARCLKIAVGPVCVEVQLSLKFCNP